MAIIRKGLTPQRIRSLFGIVLAGMLFAELKSAATSSAPALIREPIVLADEVVISPVGDDRSFVSFLKRDPLAALEQARADHLRDVRDYNCTFVKQELLPGGMSAEQVIAVNFRQEPYSVVMHWLKNPGKAERVIYVKGRWTDAGQSDPALREQAMCQPGAIARLIVKSLKQPIRGSLAQQSSRRCIDEFGFARGLDLLITYCRMARDRGELDLRYVGTSEIDGRPTWVVERRLPYAGPEGRYPDRIAVVHIDQQWRVPVSVHCFADDARTLLLGRYDYADVVMGVGHGENVFDPKSYGM
ncbi:MAG: DUF1571 domain-containing protein [Phycisphaerae bacterium]